MRYTKTNTLLKATNVGLSFVDKTKSCEKCNGTGKIDNINCDICKGTGIQYKNILSDINFQVKDIVTPERTTGQVISLVGKSGSGKTQLLRMLSGLYIHNAKRSGEILIHHDKQACDHILSPVKEGDMGIVFQDYYIPEWLKVRKMLIKAAKKNPDYKGDSKLIEAAVDSYLNDFELYEHKDKYPIQLSGGQKQRASIIMQLLNGSYFLLMDEPFSGLDPLMIDKTTSFLQKVANSDELKTLIIVSHDLVNCAAISDMIFVLSSKGREINTGSTIVSEIDLLARDLAYHPEIKLMPAFHETISEVKNLL